MEHDQRVCPRCGEPSPDYGFCKFCRSHMDSPAGISTHAAGHAGDATYPATRALQEVARLEEALAAASKGISERIAARTAAAPVQLDPDPHPIANVPASAQTSRDVARLEDVLTVAPTSDTVAPTADDESAADAAADTLREAFWFEQASAFRPSCEAEHDPGQSAQPAGREPAADAQPVASHPRGRWPAALCLLALIALVVLLTGHSRRRSS